MASSDPRITEAEDRATDAVEAKAQAPQLSVVFLGTGARQPTASRGVPATMIVRGGERILVDCGEGTQRQLLRSSVGLHAISAILITHIHADHVLGLPGLLATFSDVRTAPLVLAGPPGTRELIDGFQPHFGQLNFRLQVREMASGETIQRPGYRLVALRALHGAAAIGWALVEDLRPGHLKPAEARRQGVPEGPLLQRLAAGEDVNVGRRTISARSVTGPPQPGRRIIFSGDTRPLEATAQAARGADLLVHEATFLSKDRSRAEASQHTTAREAARLAESAGVRALALIHHSQRYSTDVILEEARRHYPGAMAPNDFDVIEVPLPEHGVPRLIPAGALTAPPA